MSIQSVFHNRIIAPVKAWRADARRYDGGLGYDRFVSSAFRGSGIGRKAEKRVRDKIYQKLYDDFRGLLLTYQNDSAVCRYDSSSPVWILWMQGYERAPVIVRKCIDSIRGATDHPVHLVTAKNLSDFYVFPLYIKEKLEKGIITNAQFSDILRMTLLSEYGGLWIDATIFIPNSIPEDVFENEFFTCKRDIVGSGYVSGYRWTSFLNGCQKGCIIQRAAKDLFFAYWKKYDYLIDYLLVDYVLLLIYENIPKAKSLIDGLPCNNPQIEELQNRMSEVYDEEKYLKLINDSDTSFFKLSWRMEFVKEKDGWQTYFGKFLEG